LALNKQKAQTFSSSLQNHQTVLYTTDYKD